jgi:hypothetical protein
LEGPAGGSFEVNQIRVILRVMFDADQQIDLGGEDADGAAQTLRAKRIGRVIAPASFGQRFGDAGYGFRRNFRIDVDSAATLEKGNPVSAAAL